MRKYPILNRGVTTYASKAYVDQLHKDDTSEESEVNGKIEELEKKVASLEAAIGKLVTAEMLDEYPTKDEVDTAVAGVIDELDNYVTTRELEDKGYIDGNGLALYSTKEEMNIAIDGINTKLADYVIEAAVDTKLAAYTNTEGMNAAIKVVDDKFANYITADALAGMDYKNQAGVEAIVAGELNDYTPTAGLKAVTDTYGYAASTDLDALETRVEALETPAP